MEAIAALAPRGWRMGLDRMQKFVELAGLDKPTAKFIHVAGTNGKGSVTATVQSILIEQGYKTGAYFSPFVYDPMERIQIGRDYISPQDFARHATRLFKVAEELEGTEYGGITEFEMKTAIGFAAWQEAECEWVALEVGLGGRLDATNVITGEVAVITSIGLDHTAILGNTLAEIAFEKAGIIKPGKPVIVGAVPDEARAVIFEEAKKKGCPILHSGDEISISDHGMGLEVRIKEKTRVGYPVLEGPHQTANLAVAIAACEAAGAIRDPEKVRDGVHKVHLPGRMERRTVGDKIVILDGAHNREAAIALGYTLLSWHGKFTVVAGMVAGHDPVAFFEPLQEIIAELHLVPINFHRAVPPEELATKIAHLNLKTTIHQTVKDGLKTALAGKNNVLVTGSFYLVGEAGLQLSAMN